MVRHNNQVPDNLPQLQNLIKRDPESYREEFQQQYSRFQSSLEVYALNASKENKTLDELVMFIAQVSQFYTDICAQFPQHLVDALKNHGTTLDPAMRNCFVKALILLRNKNLIPALELLELFFQLLRCPDKHLRSFLQTHIISDIKNLNAKNKDMKLNSMLQNFMYRMISDTNPRAAKMSVDVMIELYNKEIWNDAKTVNVIANVGCFSEIPKVRIASLKFFLNSHNDAKDSDESDSGNEIDLKAAIMQNRINKKTKKRQKQLQQLKKEAVKEKKKKKAPAFNFSGIHFVHNPQGMAEQLFKQLRDGNERFESKLMHLDVISRLIGVHELFLFSFYPYVTRFLQPHHRQVTRILQFVAQAAHELVPNDVLEPVLKTIANNFITERNSSDVMAIGLNAIREICLRCPLAMDSDLLQDLAMYKAYKEKSVMMAARSLIMLYRDQLPALLHKRDRGRLTEAQVDRKVLGYGEKQVYDTVPGTEALLNKSKEIDIDSDSDESSADSDWVDIPQSDGENEEVDDNNSDEDNDESENDEEYEEDDDDEDNEKETTNESIADTSSTSTDTKAKSAKVSKQLKILNEKEAAQELAMSRILTDEDFKRIQAAQLKKTVTNARKRPLETERSEFVKLDDIEMIYKKRKHDKESRLETVKAGRTDRSQFGYKDGRKNEHSSRTQREKRKNKNFQMVRQKARGKVKKSFRDKQRALRNHLVHQKKMK